MTPDGKLLELKHVGKRFGATVALADVDFDLNPGEVHGLVGENGAGKSTLMKILSGVHGDYDGEIVLKGKPTHFRSTKDALTKGIGMIYQELSVVRSLTVAENIFMTDSPRTAVGTVDWKQMYTRANEHMRTLGLNMNVRSELGNFTVATQQMVEIARVLFSGADIIIMDEPTSALSHAEAERLFGFIRNLKAQGKGIVFISHFLEDVLRISDRITVLRNGRKVMTVKAREVNLDQLTEAVLGQGEQKAHRVGMLRTYEAKPITGSQVLQVKNLGRGKTLQGVNFSISAGEILGIYGAMGAGKDVLAQCLFGGARPDEGEIWLDGKKIDMKTTSAAKRLGIAYVPANRRETLFPAVEVYKNISIAHLGDICRNWVTRGPELKAAKEQVTALGVRPANPSLLVSNLSGGNQQKVVLAKWLTKLPRVLVLNDPTRGMDVGAKREVMDIVEKLREKGIATLLLSSEPELLMAYADRVVVLARGRQVDILPNAQVTKESLLAYS
ncbi:MAG: sugar ABC transporter ATP-binding protein [Rudaea sp.]